MEVLLLNSKPKGLVGNGVTTIRLTLVEIAKEIS